MTNNYLANMSEEDRAISLQLARQAKVAKAAFREANKHLYKTSYLDEAHWAALATKYKVRMPSMDDPATAKVINKYLKRCKVSNDEWCERYTSSKYFVTNNTKWTAYAVAGLILEIRDEKTLAR